MAAVQGLRPSPPMRSSSASEVPKLRNSCDACASSKLKCSKDRPKCSRCVKRGLACDFFAVKKAGRKPNRRPSMTRSSSNPSIDPPPPSSPEAVHLPSPKPSMSETSDMLQEPFGSSAPSMSATFTNADTNFDDFFTSPMAFSLDAYDVNFFDTADFLPKDLDDGSIDAPDSLPDAFWEPIDPVSKLLSFPCTGIAPKTPISFSNELGQPQEVPPTETPCSCLGQALALMRQISSPSSPYTCTTWSGQNLDTASGKPSIHAVIAQNEATIDSMSAMLDCLCLQDGYVLAVMSLIIFKALGWYAAVAWGAPSVQFPPTGRSPSPSSAEQALQDSTTVGNFRLEGEDSARLTAQLVLGELHRVRQLIDRLSPKLKVHAARKEEEPEGAEAPESRDVYGEMALPLSAVMYHQLDVDLRRRLKAVSREIIDRLKRL